MMKRFCILILAAVLSLEGYSQFVNGTTGLLHAPTAEMQQDKTFMAGGGYLSKHATPSRWDYDTWNYYLNITIFPWLEVAYTLTVFDEWIWRGKHHIHMINQDRNFSARLRLWKEGWWKPWTPQIVVGANDPTTGAGTDYTDFGVAGDSNGYWNRFYIAATKHLHCLGGEWGLHAGYVYNVRNRDKLNGPTAGVSYQFDLPHTHFFAKFMNGFKLMAEYDSKFVNVGGRYRIWKDHINVIAELRDCKHPSVGMYFKVHLK